MRCAPRSGEIYRSGGKSVQHHFIRTSSTTTGGQADNVQSVNVHEWLCVGEWSRRTRYNSAFIRGRRIASSLIVRQWRSRVGRRLLQSSHSTAKQWTATTTRPRRHKLPSRSARASTIMLQRTHITTLRSTRQQRVEFTVLRHLALPSTLTQCFTATVRNPHVAFIGVDLAGLLGDAWRAPKVGRCRVGWGTGRGVPSPAD